MSERDMFRDALQNFTFDVASGGAIEHLADLGYTPQEIKERLDFPTPYGQVQEAYWSYCRKRQIILEDIEECRRKPEQVHYVTEYDAYGRKSFRKVVEQTEAAGGQKETAHAAYVTCDFGMRAKRAPLDYETFLSPLTEAQRKYMDGIPWPRKVVWHVLDDRMKGIIATLREQSDYHGTIAWADSERKEKF